ncbi:MAG: hypothetical protein LBC77_00005 [Spirochaetaceae bacterium]|jgi:hypothetical protein|nr:hypothetical protein [Spirochaetaceae bacterium]
MRNWRVFLPVALLCASALAAQDGGAGIAVEERKREITGEASPELFAMNIWDADVSLSMAGYWKGSLFGTWGLAKTKFGWGVAENESPILWAQEADLTLSLWIKERWFVEASFQEDYDVNTFRAGYQGGSGSFVRYAGVGNTGLDFPVFPYLDLGGDSASSLGFYGAFGTGPLSLHTLVRYDAAEREERVFAGAHERTYTALSPDAILRGVSFVLPETELSSVPVVYFEDKDGALSGENGTRWRPARPSEAAASARDGLVELAGTPSGMVAVAYPAAADYSLGSYNDAGSFLGEAQTFFGSLDLSAYPQSGQRNSGVKKPGVIMIDGVSALVVYEKGTFSPFERQSRYTAPVSNTASAALVNSSSKDIIPGWEIFRLTETPLPSSPLYTGEEEEGTARLRRDIYELAIEGQRGGRSVEARWPLVRDTKGAAFLGTVYLTGAARNAGIEIRFTSYSLQSGYVIGQDVLAGSITVLRGGISDPNWSFDPGSGAVTLQTPAQFNEIVRISYLRRSLDRQRGSIAAGLGAVYAGEGRLSARGALGLRWNVSGEGYSEDGVTSPGVAGFGGEVLWKNDYVRAGLSLGAGYRQPDTTGLYRIAGMEGHEEIFELPDSSFISHETVLQTLPPHPLPLQTRAPLAYRNYRSTNFAGGTTLMPIEWDAPLVPSLEGPYPAKDGAFNARIMALEFTLDSQHTWTGFQAALPSGSSITGAEEILIPFRLYEAQGNFNVHVQFGALRPKDGSGDENPLLILEADLGPATDAPRAASIRLGEADRRLLAGATFVRFIVTGTGSARLLFAPPVFRGAAFSPVAADGAAIIEDLSPMPVRAVETIDSSLAQRYADEIKRLHPAGEKQRVLELSWPQDFAFDAGVGSLAGKIPLTDYKALSFFVKVEAATRGELEFSVMRSRSSYGKHSEIALEARISAAEITRRGAGGWTKIELRYAGAETGAFIDGNRVAPVVYRPEALRKHDSADSEFGIPEENAYILALLKGAPETKGFSLDEIALQDGSSSVYINSGLRFSLANVPALAASGVTIVDGVILETALETAAAFKPDTPQNEGRSPFTGAASRSHGELSLFGTKLTGDFSFAINDGGYGRAAAWTAGHGISRAFGPVSIGERFFLDPAGENWRHRAEAALTGRYHALFNAEGSFANSRLERRWRGEAGVSAKKGVPLSANIGVDWRWQGIDGADGFNTGNWWDYGRFWLESWNTLLPDDGGAAQGRFMRGSVDFRAQTLPVGAGVNLSLTQDASKIAQRSASVLRAVLDIPWKAGTLGGSVRMERGFERSLKLVHKTASGDLSELSSALKNSGALLGAIPLYALFDPEAPFKLDAAINSGNSEFVTGGRSGDSYSLSLRFPAEAGLKALFLPRETELHINRNIVRLLDTTQDILGFGGALRFSAVNLFGAYGTARLFSFYQNDEIRHALSAAVALPKHDEPSWRIRAEQGAVFYGFRGAELHFTNAVTLLRSGWLLGLGVEWHTGAEKTLAAALFDWFIGKFESNAQSPALSSLAAAPRERLRKEKLQLDLDFSGIEPRASLSAGHESIVRVTGRLSFILFAALSASLDNNTNVLSFILTAGSTINVSF